MKYSYNGILHRNEKEPLHSTFVCLTKNMNTKKYIPYNCMFMKFKIDGDRSQNSGPVCAKACETVVMHGRVSAAPGGPPHFFDFLEYSQDVSWAGAQGSRLGVGDRALGRLKPLTSSASGMCLGWEVQIPTPTSYPPHVCLS